jgi:hypothetical protein
MPISLELKNTNQVSTKSVRDVISNVKIIRQIRKWFPNTVDDTLLEIEEYFDGLIEAHTGEANNMPTTRKVKKVETKEKSELLTLVGLPTRLLTVIVHH